MRRFDVLPVWIAKSGPGRSYRLPSRLRPMNHGRNTAGSARRAIFPNAGFTEFAENDAVKVLFAASEVAGFAKTGGLADVCAALPRALARRGHECIVVMPLY